MRVLHLGNIAGNGYQNAKFQRRKGIEAYTLSYDYRYCIGQPEWEDGEFEGSVPDPNVPDWPSLKVRHFERPSWFDDTTSVHAHCNLHDAVETMIRQQPHRLRRTAYGLLNGLLRARTKAAKFDLIYGLAQRLILAPEQIEVINRCLALYASAYPHLSSRLQPADVITYMRDTPRFREVLQGYDVIQAYSTDTIHTMLVQAGKPFTAFDHGNMREIPWEDSARGRMLQLSYQAAYWIFMTNADTIESAKKMKLQRYSFLPHPVDDTRFAPVASSPLRTTIQERHQCDTIVFAPSRHNWELKGNDIMIRAFARVATQLNGLLIFCDWGQEMDRSRALIDDLKLTDRVLWIPAVGKMKLRDYYNASDLVLDQFKLGVFGSTAPEVMACGRPAVLAFEPAHHQWCFEEMPPVVHAHTVDELAEVMATLGADRKAQQAVGEKAREWFLKYHSWERVADQQIAKYKEMLGRA